MLLSGRVDNRFVHHRDQMQTRLEEVDEHHNFRFNLFWYANDARRSRKPARGTVRDERLTFFAGAQAISASGELVMTRLTVR